MKRTLILGLCSITLAASIGSSAGDEPAGTTTPSTKPAEKREPSFWMKKKLEYSQQIIAGLTSDDFEAIRRSAQAMNNLGQIEGWVHAGRADYRTQLAIFHDANQQLISQADDKDVDGATLAFVQLTLSCVNCHKVVRDANAGRPNR